MGSRVSWCYSDAEPNLEAMTDEERKAYEKEVK